MRESLLPEVDPNEVAFLKYAFLLLGVEAGSLAKDMFLNGSSCFFMELLHGGGALVEIHVDPLMKGEREYVECRERLKPVDDHEGTP